MLEKKSDLMNHLLVRVNRLKTLPDQQIVTGDTKEAIKDLLKIASNY